jgi:hypothetical protein
MEILRDVKGIEMMIVETVTTTTTTLTTFRILHLE